MKICVCGQGKLGFPMLQMFRKKGFKAIGYDLDWTKSEGSIAECVDQSDTVVIIVPTPSLPDGSFSNEHVVEALHAFYEESVAQDKFDYLFIVGSTVVPGSCESFRHIVGDNLCYKPELIRLEFVHHDLTNPPFVLIGETSKEIGDRVENISRHVSSAPVKRMSLTEAELAKITLNCALTMKISLANQLHLVASKMGCDSKVIMDAVGTDPRIGHAYLEPGWPYGGPCLPRDNRMFGYVASQVGVDAVLSDATDCINEKMG